MKKARERLGIGTWKLAKACGFPQVTVLRIERGEFKHPDPDKLTAMAEVLGLDPVDVLTRAGYPIPTELLSLGGYLRAKYHKALPGERLDALEKDVIGLLGHYGLDTAEVGHSLTTNAAKGGAS